jgi:type I restriction enzyme S subunit
MSWEKVKLGDVTDSCLGKMLDQRKNKGSYKPYLANNNVRWGTFDLEHLQKMRFEDDEDERYGIKYGDLIICEGGEPGRCAIWKDQIPNMKIQKALHRVRVHNDMDYRYVYYWFLLAGQQGGLRQYYTGATIMHMPGQKLKEVLIEKPPIEIQRRIGTYLEVFDNLIENNKKQIKLLEEAAQRLYKEWFVDLRFPGYEDWKIVDGVPEGWKRDTIDSRIELLSGYAFKSKEFVTEGKYKIVTIKNVKDGQFDGENVSRMVDIPPKMPEHCKLNDGDILLSLTGNVGRVCMVIGEDYLLNQRVAKLKSQTPAFTYCLFRSKDMFEEMNNLANGAAQQNLSPVRTGKIETIFPADELIVQFESAINPVFKQILIKNKTIKELSQARNFLLPKLMSGEIEV